MTFTEHGQTTGDIIKHTWIFLQSLMMAFFMIIGTRAYYNAQRGWQKVNSLFVFYLFVIVFLIVNEFMLMNFKGVFFILLFGQYSYFLTYCVVIDSCITAKDDEMRWQDEVKAFNFVFRIGMHSITLILAISTFFISDCNKLIYPANFLLLIVLILLHNFYDIFLSRRNYMINWEKLPPTSPDKLRYNKELTQKQLRVLMYSNIVFGAISCGIVCVGFFIVNKQSQPEAVQHIECKRDVHWSYQTVVGDIFATLHQLLILMQINVQLYVLVRIPRDMKIFEQDTQHLVKAGVQVRLLDTIMGHVTKTTDGSTQENDTENTESNQHDDDFKRVNSLKSAVGQRIRTDLKTKSQVELEDLAFKLIDTHHTKKDTFRV